MESAAYKFANQVLPLALADAAQGRQPKEDYSQPNTVSALPQGPTATTSPAIPAPVQVEPHVAGPAPQKAASFEAQLVKLATAKLQAKQAGLAGAAMNFGRGALATAKPLVGLFRGGLPGAGKGVVNAAKTIYKGGPAAAAGAGTALYAGYNTLRNPIVQDAESFRVQSPIRIPDVRWRSPIVTGPGAWGSGFRVQKPWKTLW